MVPLLIIVSGGYLNTCIFYATWQHSGQRVNTYFLVQLDICMHVEKISFVYFHFIFKDAQKTIQLNIDSAWVEFRFYSSIFVVKRLKLFSDSFSKITKSSLITHKHITLIRVTNSPFKILKIQILMCKYLNFIENTRNDQILYFYE